MKTFKVEVEIPVYDDNKNACPIDCPFIDRETAYDCVLFNARLRRGMNQDCLSYNLRYEKCLEAEKSFIERGEVSVVPYIGS